MAGSTDHACSDLGAFLASQIKAKTDKIVYLHILTDSFEKPDDESEWSTSNWKSEFLARKHVILVFQRRDLRNSVLVIGMSVHEYAEKVSNKFTRAYIQYVDTTGLFLPRPNQSSLTKSLVCSYFQFAQSHLKMQSIHLMASAKPSFLFAGSEFNPEKNRLSTSKLVKWWLTVVEGIPNTSIKVWSPGEDLADDNRTSDRIARRQVKSVNIQWSYGPFYRTDDHLSDIPLFEDDPKFKHLQTFATDYGKDKGKLENAKAKSFIETLGLRPEFRNQCHSTLIVVAFIENKSPSVPVPQARISQLAAFSTKMLSNLTFENEAKVMEASGKITSWLKFMGSKPLHIKIDSVNDSPEAAIKSMHDENQPINIQGLVKKQKANQ